MLDEHGILFISDEVQTGWGRTGEHFWGYQAHGVVPDVMTFAKGSATASRSAAWSPAADLMDSLPANSISTFGGNPMVTSGALPRSTSSTTTCRPTRERGAQLADGLRGIAESSRSSATSAARA